MMVYSTSAFYGRSEGLPTYVRTLLNKEGGVLYLSTFKEVLTVLLANTQCGSKTTIDEIALWTDLPVSDWRCTAALVLHTTTGYTYLIHYQSVHNRFVIWSNRDIHGTTRDREYFEYIHPVLPQLAIGVDFEAHIHRVDLADQGTDETVKTIRFLMKILLVNEIKYHSAVVADITRSSVEHRILKHGVNIDQLTIGTVPTIQATLDWNHKTMQMTTILTKNGKPFEYSESINPYIAIGMLYECGDIYVVWISDMVHKLPTADPMWCELVKF